MIIDYISYGDDMMERIHPKPDDWGEIAENIYISGYEKETFKHLGFYIGRKDFAKLENRNLITEGSAISVVVCEAEKVSYGYDHVLLEVAPSNYHDLNVQVSEFPKVLLGKDPITETYTFRGKLIGGADAGKKVEVQLSKDACHDFTFPIRKCVSFNRLRVLQEEDARLFLVEGDALTFKSCSQIDDGIYESMGWFQPLCFDAEATLLSTKYFYQDDRFKKGHGQLSVMFNTSYLIGRVCNVDFSAEENPNFPICSKLKITGAQKRGIGETPHITARSVRLACA